MKVNLALSFLMISFLFVTSMAAQDNDVITGTIEGAPFKVVVPENWDSGKVFFHVHGWRPADAPHVADFDPDDPFYRAILEEGWAIGRTAFLKNGVDHNAHTKALYDLKYWIEENTGSVQKLIMEGESTAGTLMLRIAEQNPDLADGVIAKGAFISFEDETHDSYLKASPRIPAILMSNLTELEGPLAYVTKAQSAATVPALRPLMRVGHVNVNWVERLAALEAMNLWLDTGSFEPITDGTREVPARETGTVLQDNTIKNRVININPFYGNAFLGFHPAELEEFGLKYGDDFIIEVHGRKWRVYYGQSYGDVPIGDWVAFPAANDTILLARNHRSAVETAKLMTGDPVNIIRLEN
ncbi:MAG: hypothetical protein EA359_10725 [Balneolaceae bacterium]|nr:MAG: hypothetical protein EA359_10725 [Balneolaceae bacterium]